MRGRLAIFENNLTFFETQFFHIIRFLQLFVWLIIMKNDYGFLHYTDFINAQAIKKLVLHNFIYADRLYHSKFLHKVENSKKHPLKVT